MKNKNIDKFWYWFLIVIAFVVCFMFASNKVSASKFYINNGETRSNITYSENQWLIQELDNNIKLNFFQINQNSFVVEKTTYTNKYTYYNCSYSAFNATMICNNYNFIGSNNAESIIIENGIEEINNFIIGIDNVTFGIENYIIDSRQNDYAELYIEMLGYAMEAEGRWNNLLNYINEKIGFTDENIKSVLANTFNGSFEEKEQYYMELIEIAWQQNVPSDESVAEILMQVSSMFDESLNNVLNSINQKINFTNEEFKNVDLFGIEENSFETPYDKVQYYINLINQRWDSYLNENGTGDGYTQEQVDQMMMEIYSMVDMVETSWDNTLKLINEKIGFTKEEIIHMLTDENGTFQLPEEKEQYYHNLINNRWESYLAENGTGGNGYSEEDLNNSYNQGFNDGKNSVDITTDNQSYANQYIIDNNYHSNQEYLNYGTNQYSNGYNNATSNDLYIVKNKVNNLFPNYTIVENTCSTTTSGSIICDEAFEGYIQTTYNWSNNIGYENGLLNADITTDNQDYANQYIIDNNYHSDSDYLNYGNEKYKNGLTSGKALGYEQANNDGKILGTFIPNLLGGFGSFFLTIMNIDILGFNLLTVFGILISILGIIVIIKFLKG